MDGNYLPEISDNELIFFLTNPTVLFHLLASQHLMAFCLIDRGAW